MTDAVEVDGLWARYRHGGDDDARERLVLQYASLVKYVASRVATGLPASVDQGDLVSYGMFGLLDAIAKFEPERGFKFETYAIPRIRGAILDELRAMDWVPRSVRTKARRIETAMSALEARLGRSPSEDELADALDVKVEELQQTMGQIARGGILGLDEIVGGPDADGVAVRDTVADDSPGPGTQLEIAEVRRQLSSSILALPERERTVLALYYYENLTLAEIGRILGVSESRVCQIHGKAVLQLRSRMISGSRD
jgi:RNA polymerase sigma factor for flagellar operon FliA